MNSVGGGTGVHFGDRPPWDWALGFAREMLPVSQGIETLQAMRYDLLTNVVTNPVGLVRAGQLARGADLTVELSELRERNLPVLALTSEGDSVIPATPSTPCAPPWAPRGTSSAAGTRGSSPTPRPLAK